MLLGRSKSELVAAAERRLAEDMGALAILSIVLFAGVGLFAEFGIRSQIGRIAKMARRLGAGDLTARVAPPYPGGELGSLMTVLNHTASSLELQRRDIEELNQKLRRAQELEALEKQRLDVAVNNMAQGLILYDASERVVICNQQFTKMMGMSPLVVKPGCTFREVIAHRGETGSLATGVEEYRATFLRNIAAGHHTPIVSTMSDGRSIQVVGKGIESGGWVATVEDITERQLVETRIAHMAHYDALTELPNRVLFRERLDHELKNISRGRQLAVFYIDIDEFKRINNSLGHPVGDELLKAVAGRLGACVTAGDVVARLGGDEFAIIQTAMSGRPTPWSWSRGSTSSASPTMSTGIIVDRTPASASRSRPATARPRSAAQERRPGAVRGQGRRARHLPLLRTGMDARVQQRRALELDLRQALERERIRAALPAAGQSGDRRDHRLRGAAALASSAARHDLAGRVHSAGRRDRADHADRRMGAAQACARGGDLAGRHQGRGQRLAGAVQAVDSCSARSSTRWRLRASTPNRLELEITEAVLLQRRRSHARHAAPAARDSASGSRWTISAPAIRR